MKKLFQLCSMLFSLLCLLPFSIGTAFAVPVQTAAPITGEIEAITITTPGDHWSGGTMTVGGQVIILPANLLINLPNDYQTLQELYLNSPAACAASGVGGARETGLAKSDKCNPRATGAQATILANVTDSGNVIAGQVDIFKALESVNGNITYIDPAQGYFRVNGTPGSSTTGVMIRVNDPTSRHTIQTGLGCDASSAAANCSADVRFKIDPDNYTFAFITGYPACIPGPGIDPANCLDANRPVVPPTPLLTATAPVVAVDSRHFAPIKLGDNIKADGNFETIGGVTFLSASSVRIFVDLTTRTTDALGNPDPTQPDYLIISEAGWDGPAYPASRVRGRFVTNASLRTPPTDIDYFSVHYDQANAPHEQILYTTQFNKQQGAVIVNAGTGVYDSQIRFSFFPPGADGQDPCVALRNGVAFDSRKFTGTPVFPASYFPAGLTIADYCTSTTPGDPADVISNYKLMVPLFREVMARSTRQQVTGLNKAIDIHGNPSQSGQYKLPVSIEYGAFEDINLGMTQFPVQFSGNPFLLDRRLSPNGCFGGCEATQQPLTPFPFEGINPDAIVANFGFTGSAVPVPNRMFAFMDATGKMTGTLAWPPANPPAFPIVVTPPLSFLPPFADEDAAATTVGVPIIINVLTNDFAPIGTIDPASVRIATVPPTVPAPIFANLPSGATVQVNPDGTITYTPAPAFSGADSFTYTVANNFGSVSLPGTVNVIVVRPPVAVNDNFSVAAKSSATLSLTGNDAAGTSLLNLASVSVTPPTCGTLVNNLDGDVLFTAPLTVPAAPGTCSFTYTVSDSAVPPLVSNTATVTVTITPPAPPVASDDVAATTTGSAIDINVIANDTSAASTINPASVAVTAPTGGTATANANGTVRYTPPATPGTYTFTYTVQDNAVPPATSNVATVTVTVAQGTQTTVSSATLTPNIVSPQLPGTPVTFIATATGGTGNYEYQFSIKTTGTPYSVVQAYSTSNSWIWTPTVVGPYDIQVDVRNVGSTAASEAAANVFFYQIETPATTVTVAPNLAAPQAPGTPITFTATASGGSGPFVYRFWVNNGNGYAIAQDYNTLNTFTWTPTKTGIYDILVDVKGFGSTVYRDAFVTLLSYQIAPAPATAVTLTPDVASPQAVGTPITFTAVASGGTAPYEYRFWLNVNGTYVIVQDYSVFNTWVWTPLVAGNYDIMVDTRAVGSTAFREALNKVFFYQIQ